MNEEEKRELENKAIQSINFIVRSHGLEWKDLASVPQKLLIDCFVTGMIEGAKMVKDIIKEVQ